MLMWIFVERHFSHLSNFLYVVCVCIDLIYMYVHVTKPRHREALCMYVYTCMHIYTRIFFIHESICIGYAIYVYMYIATHLLHMFITSRVVFQLCFSPRILVQNCLIVFLLVPKNNTHDSGVHSKWWSVSDFQRFAVVTKLVL